MPYFDKDSTDLPSVDKDGNAITNDNPLTLADVLVRQIEQSDAVRGMRIDRVLNLPVDSPINWALLGLYLRDIFLGEKIDGLETAVSGLSSVTDASETVKGIAEIANQTEGRAGTDTTRIMTAARIVDALRNGSVYAADTTRKGVVERATQTEVEAGTDTEKYVTPKTLKDFFFSTVTVTQPNLTLTLTKTGGTLSLITTGDSAPFFYKTDNIVFGGMSFTGSASNSDTITITFPGTIHQIMFAFIFSAPGGSLARHTDILISKHGNNALRFNGKSINLDGMIFGLKYES